MPEKKLTGLQKCAIALLLLIPPVNCQSGSKTGSSQIPDTSEIVLETVEAINDITQIETCKTIDPGALTSDEYDALTYDEKEDWLKRAEYYLAIGCNK